MRIISKDEPQKNSLKSAPSKPGFRVVWKATVRYVTSTGPVVRLWLHGQTPLPGSSGSGCLIEALVYWKDVNGSPDKVKPGTFGVIYFDLYSQGVCAFSVQPVRLA